LGEGEEVDREVSPSILNIEEKEQSDNLPWVNRELGYGLKIILLSHTFFSTGTHV
jgi:hypothetical protein